MQGAKRMEWKCAGCLGVGLEILEIHLNFFLGRGSLRNKGKH